MTTARVRRSSENQFTATNDRGAEVAVGRGGQEGSFSPSELLLIAVGACAQVTAESLLTRRVGDAAQEVTIEAVKDQQHERYPTMRVSFDVDFSSLEAEQRDSLSTAVLRAIERHCTVSRTVEPGAEVVVELGGQTT